MDHRTRTASLLTLAVLLLPAAAHPGANDSAVIALHVARQTKPFLPVCPLEESILDGIPCSAFDTEWSPGEAVEIYLVAARGDSAAGIGGFACGIQYTPGIAFPGWTSCAPMETPAGAWPASGATNRLEWPEDCRRTLLPPHGVHALGGAFYVYAYGPATFRVAGPAPTVWDCAGEASTLTFPSGIIGFSDRGEVEGFNPCSGVPVTATTWGRLKRTPGADR